LLLHAVKVNKRLNQLIKHESEYPLLSKENPTHNPTFNHHSELSNYDKSFVDKMNELLGLGDYPTRVEILQQLKSTCNVMKDIISQKRFDRMPKKHLKLIIKVGENCYYVRNIYKWWKEMASKHLSFRPLKF